MPLPDAEETLEEWEHQETLWFQDIDFTELAWRINVAIMMEKTEIEEEEGEEEIELFDLLVN